LFKKKRRAVWIGTATRVWGVGDEGLQRTVTCR